jgi:hypothetical protein
MKELIMDRLSRMENLEERKLLKDILNSVFVNVVDYNEQMFDKLSNDILQEIEYQEDLYTIFSSLVSRENYDPVDEFLYPMNISDIYEDVYDGKILMEELENTNKSFLTRIFLECDYLILQEILKKESYVGTIHTENHTYDIQIHLRQSHIYRKGIEELYQSFIRNGVIWTTLNCPYIEKFVDVVLIEMKEKMDPNEKIINVVFDLGEYNIYQKRDMIPLWNVKTVMLPSLTFPIPAKDHVNHQHELTLAKEGKEHGYLVCFDDSFTGYVKRNEDTLTVIAPVPEITDWKVKKVVMPPKENKLKSRVYELMANQIQNSFINRYSKKQGKVIRTKAELIRVIQSFEVAKSIDLVEFAIMDSTKNTKESYPMDFFLVDEIREQRNKKILLLDFKAEEFDFLTRDKISFLVSELQQYFPEYLCEGRLLS